MDADTPPLTARVQVLLVASSRHIRESTQALFDRQRFEVQIAEDGFEALCEVVAHPPDAVVMDANLPELDGYDTCALLAANSRYAHIPVVLLVNEDNPVTQARAEIAGVRRVLLKPFGRRDLLQLVQACLRCHEPEEGAPHDLRADHG